MMNFISTMMNFVLKMVNFVVKMMDLGPTTGVYRLAQLCVGRGSGENDELYRKRNDEL